MSWLYGIRTRLRLLFSRRSAESRMDEEMSFHVEMEAARLQREAGLAPGEARRRARVAFGGQERYREEMREGRGFAWLSGLTLDLKLGARMLLKFPVLTLAGTLAIAVAVGLAAAYFEFMSLMVNPKLPLSDSDRIVVIQNFDPVAGAPERRSLHDFEAWRESLTTVRHLTAAASGEFSVSTPDGRIAAVTGARIQASAFPLLREQPLLGRALTTADEQPGAPLAVVIGYDVWQELFEGDRGAIGQNLRVGAETATVVGVMPEGFRFPVNQSVWIPFRYRAIAFEPRQGPAITVFGRLAPGVDTDEAQAELSTIGQRMAVQYPQTHERLRPRIRTLQDALGMTPFVAMMNIPFLLFLVVVCGNVATLVFARTAQRESEIALRSALGASRRRLVLQLFAESLVLTTAGTLLGLAAARAGLGWGMALFWEVQQMTPPFWFRDGLSIPTLVYAALLAVIAATIIGGLPALKATGRRLRHQLAQAGTGGAGMRFGRISTAVVVVQVAICVAFIPYAVTQARGALQEELDVSVFPADEFLSARLTRETELLGSDGDASAAAPQSDAAAFAELKRRLEAEAGVEAVTFATIMPGFNHAMEELEVEGDSTLFTDARTTGVDEAFFRTMGARIVQGRGFRAEDFGSELGVAVADRDWAREHFGGRNAIGRRVRYPGRDGEAATRWYEIVGVVDGMDVAGGPGSSVALYQPVVPGSDGSSQLYVRTQDAPETLVPRLQAIIEGVDPTIGMSEVRRLDEAWRPVYRGNQFLVGALTLIAGVILLFALVGIFALMSFTVTQRAREIGIRMALGAQPRGIVAAVFSRALAQIGLGVLAGATLVSFAPFARTPEGPALIATVASLMALCGLVGCALPAARALRIQPTDALRAE